MKKLKAFLFRGADPSANLNTGCFLLVYAFALSFYLLYSTFHGEVVNGRIWVVGVTGMLTLFCKQLVSRGIAIGLFPGISKATTIATFSRSTVELTVLGGEIGALGLPEILIRHHVFGNLERVPFLVHGILPSPLLGILALVTALGGLFGIALVGGLCANLDMRMPTRGTENRKDGPLDFWRDVLFAWLLVAPLLLLFLWHLDGPGADTEFNLWTGLVVIAASLLAGGAFFELGQSIFHAVSSARPPRFLRGVTEFGWAFGAILGWWLGGGYATLCELNQHKVVFSPLQERLVLLSWSLESLIGACAIASLAGWGLGLWKNRRSVR